MDEAGAALDVLSPRVALTYAEAGGWGRALTLEARRRRVPTVGLQHGFIYRHWLNYLHEPDEMQPLGTDAGFPLPTRTLLFDDVAAGQLAGPGHFPAESLIVTGSARLDQLAADVARLRTNREAIRLELGVAAGRHVVVLAAKFSEIARDLPGLCKAVAAQPAVQLLIKPHPAETPEVYAASAAAAPNVRIALPGADLARLLAAADLLVTKNSTVAIDGLVLGLPALVIGLPNNLSPFVSAGVMLGANGDAVGPALAAVLYDQDARARLVEKAGAFAASHDMQSDGRAARRAALAITGLMTGRTNGNQQ
jgi:hypothetical protein